MLLNRILYFQIIFGLFKQSFSNFCVVNWNHSAITLEGLNKFSKAIESNYINAVVHNFNTFGNWSKVSTDNTNLTKTLGKVLDQRWEGFIFTQTEENVKYDNHWWSYRKANTTNWTHEFYIKSVHDNLKGYWIAKVHRYNFLLCEKNGINETVNVNVTTDNEWSWFYMYVAMCDHCELTIEIWNKNMQSFTFIEKSESKSEVRWKPIQIWAVGSSPFNLSLITYSNRSDNIFWAISDKMYLSPCPNLTRNLKIEEMYCRDVNNKQIRAVDTYHNCLPERPHINNTTILPTPSKAQVAEIIIMIIIICLVIILVLILALFIRKKYVQKEYIPIIEFSTKDDLVHILNNSTTGVKIADFESVVKKLFLANDTELESQFESFRDRYIQDSRVGKSSANKGKNKSSDVVPYGYRTVKLKSQPCNLEATDYIDASYIKGVDSSKEYIISRSPLESMIEQFWTMIWEEEIEFIICMTGKDKKEVQYWPNLNEKKSIDNIEIMCNACRTFEYFDVRTFTVNRCGQSKQIIQYYYSYWPNLKTNRLFTHMFIEFVQELLKIPHNTHPILLHSEEGIGSVGVIAVCDMAIRLSLRTGQFDLCGLSKEIMSSRANVLTLDLYKFLHLLIFEYQLAEDDGNHYSQFKVNANGRNIIQSSINKNVVWETLDKLKWLDDVQCNFFKPKEKYPKKNRYNNFPKFHSCLKLKNMNVKYFNATLVDGYRLPNKFIITQYPLSQTKVDFWNMILEKKVSIIINLHEVDLQHSAYPELWPSEIDMTMQLCEDITIKCKKQEYNLSYDEILLELLGKGELLNTITIITMKYWYVDIPILDTTHDILSVWNKMAKCQMPSKNNIPIVVISDDGINGPDIYVALDYLLEKMKSENTFDPLGAIRAIKRSYDFSFNVEKIQFLQKCALDYLNLDEYL